MEELNSRKSKLGHAAKFQIQSVKPVSVNRGAKVMDVNGNLNQSSSWLTPLMNTVEPHRGRKFRAITSRRIQNAILCVQRDNRD